MLYQILTKLFPRSTVEASSPQEGLIDPAPSRKLSISRERVEGELSTAVIARGTLPLSLEVVEAVGTYLRAGKVRLDDLVILIHRDPVLVARLIAATNRAMYHRGQPILTIAETVRKLGTKRLLDTITELGLTASFASTVADQPTYAFALQRSIVFREIAQGLLQNLNTSTLDPDSLGVALALWELPMLGLARTFPGLYATTLFHRDAAQSTKLDTGVEYWVGLSRPALVQALSQAMLLPEELRRFLSYASLGALRGSGPSSTDTQRLRETAGICMAATALSDEYIRFSGRAAFDELTREWQTRLSLPGGSIAILLARLHESVRAQWQHVGVRGFRIPGSNYFSRAASTAQESPALDMIVDADDAALAGAMVKALRHERKSGRADELSLCFRIWLTFQAIMHCVGIHRCILLAADYECGVLRAVAWRGKEPHGFHNYERSLLGQEDNASVEVLACRDCKAVFSGRPISNDAAMAFAFPIILGGQMQGVFYGERLLGDESNELSLDDKMRLVALAEFWRDSPQTPV